MTCAVCGNETEIGQAYMLPKISSDGGYYRNLVACSTKCRDEWARLRDNVRKTYGIGEVKNGAQDLHTDG